MNNAQIIKRLDSLEHELDKLKTRMATDSGQNEWRSVAGSFANDPLFEKAMSYGAAYRKSLRPKSSPRTKRR